MKQKKERLKKLLLLIGAFTCIIQSQQAFAQTDHFNQFWNEYALNHTLNDKWAVELDIGLTFSSVPNQTSVFGSLSQVYGRGWVHFNPTDKWKLSFFYAYYYNHYVPEINQRQAPEWRSAMQGIYYIHKGRYTLSSRFRIEDRHIYNPDSVYEAVNRFRAQIKIAYPINGTTIHKGVVYGFSSDELYFKTHSKISGPNLFDRNRFTIGLGYAVNNSLQVELSYANELLPRSPTNEVYNAFQFNVSINNLFERLGSHLFNSKKPVQAIESAN